MENAAKFKKKLHDGILCLGVGISFTDATVTEALCGRLDFVWIDMEHNPLSLEDVQAHIMATKGSDTASLVRVRWNDPSLIKPILDIGADGIVVPHVRTAADVRLAVAACKYPPEGVRGFGPRRPSKYGRNEGPEFCRQANEDIAAIVVIEQIDAVNNLDEILAVPGLTAVCLGPNDLSGSMGLMAQPHHPDVIRAIETVIVKAKRAKIPVCVGATDDTKAMIDWVEKGANWLLLGVDWWHLTRSVDQMVNQIRQHTHAAFPNSHTAPLKIKAGR